MYFLNSVYKQNKVITSIFFIIFFIIIFQFYSCNSEQKNYQEINKEAIKKNKPWGKKIPEKTEQLRRHIIDKFKQCVVLVTAYDSMDKEIGTGTGFVFFQDGKYVIIANRHVVADSVRIRISVNGKVFYTHNVIGVDAETDIVLLSRPKRHVFRKVLKHSSSIPNIGKKVYLVSNTSGDKLTITADHISAIEDIGPFGKVFQITSPLPPDASGSPVVNKSGNVIGVSTLVELNGEKINLIIPISKIKDIQIVDKIKISGLNKIDLDFFSNLETDYEKGEYLISNKEYKNALPYLEKAIEEEPENSEIKMNLGISYRETGLIEKSIKLFKDLISENININQAHFELGLSYIKHEIYDKALRALEFVNRNDPDYENLNFQFGIIFNGMKSYKKAIYQLEKAAGNSFNSDHHYLLGMVHIEMNQIDRAIKAIRNALNLEEKNITYIIKLGSLYYKAGRFSYGIDVLSKGFILEPNNCEINLQLGLNYLGSDYLENAERKYDLLKKSNCKNQGAELNWKISSYKSKQKNKK